MNSGNDLEGSLWVIRVAGPDGLCLFAPKPASNVPFKRSVDLIAKSNCRETFGLTADNLLDDLVETNGNRPIGIM